MEDQRQAVPHVPSAVTEGGGTGSAVAAPSFDSSALWSKIRHLSTHGSREEVFAFASDRAFLDALPTSVCGHALSFAVTLAHLRFLADIRRLAKAVHDYRAHRPDIPFVWGLDFRNGNRVQVEAALQRMERHMRVIRSICGVPEPVRAPRAVAVQGTAWKEPLRERLARLPGLGCADAAATMADWAFLDRLPDQVCQLLIEYLVAAGQGAGSKTTDDIRCEARRYEKYRQLPFVYGLAHAHMKESTPERWREREETRRRELEAAALPEPEDPNVGRVWRAFESDLRTVGIPDGALSGRVEELLTAGVSARDPRLAKLLRERVETLTGSSRLKTLRRVIRDLDEKEEEETEPAASVLPPDWPWFACTRGRHALVFGGMPRPGITDRLCDAFGFANVDWPDAEHSPRILEQTMQRLKNGTYDFVFVLARFTAHVSDGLLAEAKRLGIPGVRVQHGYGVNRLRHEIEEGLPRPSV